MGSALLPIDVWEELATLAEPGVLTVDITNVFERHSHMLTR